MIYSRLNGKSQHAPGRADEMLAVGPGASVASDGVVLPSEHRSTNHTVMPYFLVKRASVNLSRVRGNSDQFPNRGVARARQAATTCFLLNCGDDL